MFVSFSWLRYVHTQYQDSLFFLVKSSIFPMTCFEVSLDMIGYIKHMINHLIVPIVWHANCSNKYICFGVLQLYLGHLLLSNKDGWALQFWSRNVPVIYIKWTFETKSVITVLTKCILCLYTVRMFFKPENIYLSVNYSGASISGHVTIWNVFRFISNGTLW